MTFGYRFLTASTPSSHSMNLGAGRGDQGMGRPNFPAIWSVWELCHGSRDIGFLGFRNYAFATSLRHGRQLLFRLLARTDPRRDPTLPARIALHARTGARLARQARSATGL